MGRPSKFSEALLEKIKSLYETGATDAQVARSIGVSKRTIENWKGRHPEFLHSIKESKEIADDLVEASLFSRAVGYSFLTEKIFCYHGQIVRAKTIKHHIPDVTAQIFWLKNRQPKRWRDTLLLGEAPPQDPDADQEQVEPETVKSFEQFCIDAGYPAPFPKQVEMAEFAMTETEPRLLLGSRGYGKTDYAVVLGIAYDIYLNPQSRTLIITKSKERNAAMLHEIAQALIKNGVKLEKNTATCLRVMGLHGKDHSVSAVTLKGITLRGRHPDRTVMDDPVTEDDTSEATRKHVVKVYNEVNKLCSNVLIIGQPAHKHDLYASLRPLLKKMEVPHGTIPELDHDLEAQRLAGVSEASIQASYFLKIVSSEQAPFDGVKYLDKFPIGESVAFIDPSHKGVDFTAMTILRGHFDGVAAFGKVWRKAWNHCAEEMVAVMKAKGVKKVCIETNGLGDMPVLMLRQLLNGSGIGVVGKDSTKEKHAKILNAGSYSHLIHLSLDSDKTYIDQVVQYEYKAKNDDAPDSLASCMEWVGLIKGK